MLSLECDEIKGYPDSEYIERVHCRYSDHYKCLEVRVLKDNSIFIFLAYDYKELEVRLKRYANPWEEYDEWKRSTI